ncbi:MAG: type II toxin-antitoxin system prevent-host-death family antitoxin [Egibacteraceae bacterium]
MAVTASELRQNIYNLLDEVLETGVPLEIERKGKKLRIVPEKPRSKLDRLVPHPGTIIGDPDDLIHMDWSVYWNPEPDIDAS